MSKETLRRILRAGGVTWQTTTTWKASTDPDFIAKMHRIMAADVLGTGNTPFLTW